MNIRGFSHVSWHLLLDQLCLEVEDTLGWDYVFVEQTNAARIKVILGSSLALGCFKLHQCVLMTPQSLKSNNISFRNINIQETFFASCFKPQISFCCTSELRSPGKHRARTLLLLSRLLADLFSQQSELALLTELGSNGCCWNQCSECTLCAELLDP